MSDDSKGWAIVLGITAGVVGGLVAGIYLYNTHIQKDPESKLRDAKEIIAECHAKIKEIEAGLQAMRQPLVV